MASRRLLAALGLVGLAGAGCATADLGAKGSAQVMLPAQRQIQYVSAELRTLKVTVTHRVTGQAYAKTFLGTALQPDPSGSRLAFVADNLAPGSYLARLEAFLDDAGTLLGGSAISEPFTVMPHAHTRVTLPPLRLADTPLGDWRMSVGLILKGGYKVEAFATELVTPAGPAQAGPFGASLASGYGFTWGNVPAFPAGVSTSSLTITAADKRGNVVTKTQVATTSILANATQSSSVNFVFP